MTARCWSATPDIVGPVESSVRRGKLVATGSAYPPQPAPEPAASAPVPVARLPRPAARAPGLVDRAVRHRARPPAEQALPDLAQAAAPGPEAPAVEPVGPGRPVFTPRRRPSLRTLREFGRRLYRGAASFSSLPPAISVSVCNARSTPIAPLHSSAIRRHLRYSWPAACSAPRPPTAHKERCAIPQSSMRIAGWVTTPASPIAGPRQTLAPPSAIPSLESATATIPSAIPSNRARPRSPPVGVNTTAIVLWTDGERATWSPTISTACPLQSAISSWGIACSAPSMAEGVCPPRSASPLRVVQVWRAPASPVAFSMVKAANRATIARLRAARLSTGERSS